ncbi:MAG: TonB-dependent receptor [Cytophagales bacterium]|nr:TonB-dependent receptor [Cytophagales bacterium]
MTVIIASFISTTFADGLKDILVDETANGQDLIEYLNDLENTYHVDLIFTDSELEAYTIFGVGKPYKIEEFLTVFLNGYYITKINNKVLVILKKSQFGILGSSKDNFILLNNDDIKTVGLNGKIRDINTKDPIVGASVLIQSINSGTLTGDNGQFRFAVDGTVHKIEIRYIGYQSSSYIVVFSRYGVDRAAIISMFQSSTELENITIRAQGNDEIVKNQLSGIEKLNIETIKKMPTFMGEVDPIRSIITLPGVSSNGEVSSGFNVRGGEPGQNLILQDGAVIYNPTHLFGFFSAFNPDIVKNIELYKGGGPATFGGRAASVLDISLKNGNLNNHSFSGGVGLISSRFTVEGPVIEKKASYVIGGRISYSDWLIQSYDNIQLKNSAANFYDLTGKIFLFPNENNSISISGYYSYDDFQLGSDSVFSWNTKNLSVNWDHTYTDNLSGKLLLTGSNYFSHINYDGGAESFHYQNSIQNLGLKYDFLFSQIESRIYNFGFESTYALTEPGVIRPTIERGNVAETDVGNQRGLETAAFIQGNFNLTDRLGIMVGLRYSGFLRLGKDKIYEFDYSTLDGRYPVIVDSALYSNGEIIDRFGGFEPRISLRYGLNDFTTLKASYYRSIQYLHLISNTTIPSPLDYWIASGPHIEPTISDQYTIGILRDFRGTTYELSLEGFYKNIDNALDYIDGADLFLNESLEAGLAQGKGTAYGFEMQLKRNEGKLNGWLSYTYSRSLRKFSSEIATLNLNSGDYYSSGHDQPHNLSVVLNYQLDSRSSFSLNFNYKTGRPITIPVSKFSYGKILSVLNYSQRNEYRMPDYHRLDVSYTLKDKLKRNKRYMGEWVFSIYNLYGRKNAYSIYFDENGMAQKLSILGSIFPSITYNFKY